MADEVLQFRQPQTQRLARFGATASVDLHCHCLPAIDDGPATLGDAVALCEALIADGITAVIATAHQLGPFEAVTADLIRSATELLSAELAARDLPLVVRPGAELRVTDDLLRQFVAGEVLGLPDGGAYVMLELPHSTLLDLRDLIDDLIGRGVTPVIAHPERNGPLSQSPRLLGPWVAQGAVLQVTAASLVGGFGPVAMRAAWDLLDSGWVSVIASDAHDAAHRPPTMGQAIDRIANHAGHAVARRLCVTNPQAVFEGKPIVKPRILQRGRGR